MGESKKGSNKSQKLLGLFMATVLVAGTAGCAPSNSQARDCSKADNREQNCGSTRSGIGGAAAGAAAGRALSGGGSDSAVKGADSKSGAGNNGVSTGVKGSKSGIGGSGSSVS